MNLLRANFPELYERHLCRHSQYGINVAHLATVIGTYVSLFGIVRAAVDLPAVLIGLTIPYITLLACSVPLRVLASLVIFLALFFVLFFTLPPVPVWIYVASIVVLYKLQAWSHKIYTVERDMSEFNRKYPKGVTLFFLLSLYELPLLLNYLCFDRKSWSAQPVPQQPADVCRDLGDKPTVVVPENS